MNLFFIIDEHTDIASSETARTQADIIMDAIRNPEMQRPENEWVGGKAAQQWVEYFTHNAVAILSQVAFDSDEY